LQVAGIAVFGPASVWHAGSHKIGSSNPACVRYFGQRARIVVDPLLGPPRLSVVLAVRAWLTICCAARSVSARSLSIAAARRRPRAAPIAAFGDVLCVS